MVQLNTDLAGLAPGTPQSVAKYKEYSKYNSQMDYIVPLWYLPTIAGASSKVGGFAQFMAASNAALGVKSFGNRWDLLYIKAKA
jgi:hypothetical protein